MSCRSPAAGRSPGGRVAARRAGRSRRRADSLVSRRGRRPARRFPGSAGDDPRPGGGVRDQPRHLPRLPDAVRGARRRRAHRPVRCRCSGAGRSVGALAHRGQGQRRAGLPRGRGHPRGDGNAQLGAHVSHGPAAGSFRGPRRALLECHRERLGLPDRRGRGPDHASRRPSRRRPPRGLPGHRAPGSGRTGRHGTRLPEPRPSGRRAA